MARRSEINYHQSKGCYRTMYKGVRYELHRCTHCDKPDGPNYRAAMAEFQRIVDQVASGVKQSGTVGELIEAYLEHREREAYKANACVRSLLQRFSERLGKLPVHTIENGDVFRWIDSHPHWKPGTKAGALATVKAAFTWASRHHTRQPNPLATLYRPRGYRKQARGAECLIPDELATLMIGYAEGRFRDVLLALKMTGARPVELLQAEGYHYRKHPPAIIYRANAERGYIHKTAKSRRSGDTSRTIHLPPEVDAIVSRNRADGGWIFPNDFGRQYRHGHLWNQWERLKQSGPVADWIAEYDLDADELVLYSWRHTWITRALERGLTAASVAALAGTSIQMIDKHYGHLAANPTVMYDEFMRTV